MTLYILRHGEAGPHKSGPDDDARPLTDEGVAEMKRAARRMAAMGVSPEVVISSPLPRALQTAQIAAGAANVLIEPRLEPGCTPGAFQDVLRGRTERSVMLVGHNDDLEVLIGWLTGGRVSLKKAGLARLNCAAIEPNGATLEWLIPPKVWNAL